jgi:hypothetical protein
MILSHVIGLLVLAATSRLANFRSPFGRVESFVNRLSRENEGASATPMAR